MFDYAHIADAVHLVFTLNTLLWVVLGVVIGVGVGAMPGLSPAPAIALLLPLTFTLSLPASLGLLIGVYKGGIYGGSISAISFATPGTAESGATVFDGHKLMQAGKGKKALHMALYASVTGDLLSSIITIMLAPALALFALNFGPSERLWLITLAIGLLGALSGDHFAKGMFAAALGLFIGTIGSDPVSMVPRNTFGQWWLANGVNLIPLIIGLFAIATMFEKLVEHVRQWRAPAEIHKKVLQRFQDKEESLTFREYRSAWKEMTIGTSVGTFVGILPGLGATVGAFLSYGLARQMSPQKHIGTGRLEGVAAAEVRQQCNRRSNSDSAAGLRHSGRHRRRHDRRRALHQRRAGRAPDVRSLSGADLCAVRHPASVEPAGPVRRQVLRRHLRQTRPIAGAVAHPDRALDGAGRCLRLPEQSL